MNGMVQGRDAICRIVEKLEAFQKEVAVVSASKKKNELRSHAPHSPPDTQAPPKARRGRADQQSDCVEEG